MRFLIKKIIIVVIICTITYIPVVLHYGEKNENKVNMLDNVLDYNTLKTYRKGVYHKEELDKIVKNISHKYRLTFIKIGITKN